MNSPGQYRGRRRATRSRRLPPFPWSSPSLKAVTLTVLLVGGVVMLRGVVPLPSASSLRSASPHQSTHAAPEGDAKPSNRAGHLSSTRLEEAREVLSRQERAISRRDREGYLDTAVLSYEKNAGRTFDNLIRMQVADLKYDQLAEDEGALTPQRAKQLGDGAFVVEAVLSFRLPGTDSRNMWSTQLRFVFVEQHGHALIAGDREGMSSGSQLPLWLDDTVDVAHGDHGLIIGTGDKDRLKAFARLADRAVPRVTNVWGRHWARFVVIVVPRTQAQMERAIGAESGSQGKVAAVTTSVGRVDPQQASHIVINPTTFAGVGQLGRLIVLTHETTHVATHATVSSMPMWLSEGFADYVGFRRSQLPVKTVAKELFDTIETSRPTLELPASTEFDPQTKGLDEAYESAWLACRYIGEHWSEKTLVRFYSEMDGAEGPEAERNVFRSVLGLTPQQFVVSWRNYVGHLADSD